MADRELMAGTMVYAVVSFLFTDLYQAYMYPIVNAYCFAVSGMPYTDEFTSEYLEKEYGIARFEWESCGYDQKILECHVCVLSGGNCGRKQ